MKKTTVRFAAVGSILLLGSLALGLAQHDARQRPRESTAPIKLAAEAPQPIVVDDIDPKWLQQSDVETSQTLVRANDDRAENAPPSLEYQPSVELNVNPLRPLASLKVSAAKFSDADSEPAPGELTAGELSHRELSDDSLVVQASGEGPGTAGLPLPALPPSLGAKPLGDTTAGDVLPAAPSLTAPQLPAHGNDNSGTTLPGWVNSGPSKNNPSVPATQRQLADALRRATSTSGLPVSAPNSSLPGTNAPSTSLPTTGSLATGYPGASLPSSSLPSTTSPAGNAPAANPKSSPAASQGGGQAWLQAPSTSSLNGAQSNGANVGGAGSASAQSVGSAALQPPPSLNTPSSPPTANRSLNDQASSASTSPVGLPPAFPTATLGAPQPAGSSIGNVPAYANNGTAGSANMTAPRNSSPTGARSLLTGSALGSLVSNQPGNRHLDGSQNPIMLIQKRMAGECQVGKRATVVITVRNAGNSTAQDVQVIDSVPVGASFAEAMPAVTPTPEGVLLWQLGEMAPGDERTINLQIVPERQGELGSTAVVRFAAQASVRTLATLPKLELTQSSAPEVLIGSPHSIDVVVKNVGTGVARGVRLEADVPTNLRHESGKAILEASFGDIAPNETRHIRLDVRATEPGQGVCALRAMTEDGLQQEQKVDLRVLAPALEASIVGPNLKYLDRQATFKVMIKNTGTAAATNCEFVMRLPSGLNFNTANKAGTYDSKQHAVFWSVPEFPAGHSEPVELTLLPVEVGVQAMSFQGTADLGVKTETQGTLNVAEQGELAFTIEQDADPIEVSSSTTYTVEVRNVGRTDHNVQLAVQLPAGSKAIDVNAPVPYSVLGDQLVFEPIPEMESRAVLKFRVEVGGLQVGTQIVRAQLKSQNRPTPVVKEEATDVYNDRNQIP